MKMKMNPKYMGKSKRSPKREVYSNTVVSQERRKITSKSPNHTPKATRKRRKTKPEISKKKGIINIRAERNEIEMNTRKDQWN